MSLRIRSYIGEFEYLYLGVASESPGGVTLYLQAPPHDAHEVADDPVVFSTNRTIARKWVMKTAGLAQQAMPIEAATMEYVRMLTPSGAVWVYGLHDNGSWYLQPMESGIPLPRTTTPTVMHKGKLLWVADPRQKPPRGGG